jgi:hypothetical protein
MDAAGASAQLRVKCSWKGLNACEEPGHGAPQGAPPSVPACSLSRVTNTRHRAAHTVCSHIMQHCPTLGWAVELVGHEPRSQVRFSRVVGNSLWPSPKHPTCPLPSAHGRSLALMTQAGRGQSLSTASPAAQAFPLHARALSGGRWEVGSDWDTACSRAFGFGACVVAGGTGG